MEFFSDPTLWTGLLILIAIEVVLSMDNLALIDVLADKLPEFSRGRARILGMCIALVARIGLLWLFWRLLAFAAPLFSASGFVFSLRAVVLLCGGAFLVIKATRGLHDRLEGGLPIEDTPSDKTGFWYITAQIAAVDAIFSMDAVVTALGLMDSLGLMIVAVVAAAPAAILLKKRLPDLMLRHPTIQILCLDYLMLIGLVLVADAVGFHIPKGYIYVIIGFSMLVECIRQILDRRRDLRLGRRTLRLRTAGAVLRFLGSSTTFYKQSGSAPEKPATGEGLPAGAQEMLYGVLTLGERHIRSIMTPRPEVTWVDIEDTPAEIRATVRQSPHSVYPVRQSSTDEVLGVVYGKDIMGILPEAGDFNLNDIIQPPVFVQESVGILRLMEVLRATRAKMVLITEEYGSVVGLVTPLDILEVIAGDFPEVGENPDFIPDGENAWKVDGGIDLHRLEMLLDADLRQDDGSGGYVTLGGYLMDNLGRLPQPGDTLESDDFCFEVLEASDRKVDLVRVFKKQAEL